MTFVGTGGVGKTTLSLATAFAGARQGRQVAAITVDPSKRLSSLLGLDTDQDSFKRVQWDGFKAPIDVYSIEPQKVFTEFVSQNLRPEYFDKLKDNGIYQQISKNLRETHNFAALYKMQEILNTKQYDLIVLDTPPCHQVVDFFESPRRLQKFFSAKTPQEKSGWYQWVQERGLQVAEGFLKTLVGPDFVEEMDSFFRFIGDLRVQIHSVSEVFISNLQRPDSKILLIYPPAKDKIQDAIFLNKQIEKNQFHIGGYVLNRAYPLGLDQGGELSFDQDSIEEKLYHYFKGLKEDSLDVVMSFKEYISDPDAFFAMIPEIEQVLKEPGDILNFATEVEKGWQPIV